MRLSNIDIYTNDKNVIKLIESSFKVQNIFSEKKLIYKKKSSKIISNYRSLNKIKNTESDLAISYGFGLIFKNKNIKKYKFGIWNIHPGDLPSFRGRHPITAAFLKDKKKIGVSIHQIDEKIDRGYLLGKSFVARKYIDDENSIKKKMFKKLPMLISTAKKNFFSNKKIKLKKGTYYKTFFNGINIENSKKYSHTYILNASKAQKSYGGIWVNNKKFIDCFFYKKNLMKKNSEIIICKNNKKLIMVSK